MIGILFQDVKMIGILFKNLHWEPENYGIEATLKQYLSVFNGVTK